MVLAEMTPIAACSGTRTNEARGVTLAVASLGVLVAQIDTSIANLALARLHTQMHADATVLRWVLDGYNLAYAAAILAAGALGDVLGRRRMFRAGLAIFIAGSIGCALAPSAQVLVAARVLTGIGAALEVPATLALLSTAFPAGAERARALGTWASMNGIAFALGPVAGGVLVDTLGWRAVFGVVVPFALTALVLAGGVPESGRAKRRIDVTGAVATACVFASLAFGGMAAGSRAWTAALVWTIVAVVSSAAFVPYALRAREPIVDPRVFRDGPFCAATVATALMTFGMYGMLFLTPLLLQVFRAFSATAAAFVMLPMSAVFAFVSARTARAVARIGVRRVVALGMGCMAAGCFGLALATRGATWLLELPLLAVGAGLGLTTGPLLGFAVGRVPPERAGLAAGIGNAARMLGATLGVAVLGGAFAHAAPHDAAPIALAYAGSGSALACGVAIALAGFPYEVAP